MDTLLEDTAPANTARFAARREQIVDVGSRLINARGLKGLSLGVVAEEIGLGGSSVTYYFRRKELLAAACFDRALDALAAQVAQAGQAPDARGRIARLLALSGTRDADGRVLAQLHELRAVAEPHRGQLVRRYFTIFRAVRGLLTAAAGQEQRLLQVMRAQVLLEVAHALPTWLHRYAPEEHGRVIERLVALLADGLAPAGARPPATAPELGLDQGDEARDRFLDAATRLINERGYRGASVDRIAAALKVTKGSFYHHLEAKDELVIACLQRSLSAIGRAQDVALAGGGSLLDRLARALGGLLAIQLGEGTPLLRSTALAVLPPELLRDAVDRSERAARRFSGMVADGIAEGSTKAVDPLIAGQLVMVALNAAFELRDVSHGLPRERAVALYASTLLDGLVDGAA